MDRLIATDIGSLITHRIAAAITSLTAGGAGNAAAVNGYTIDLAGLRMPSNADIVFHMNADLSADKTLNLTALKIQDSAAGDGSDWADFAVLPAPGVVVTGTGTVSGTFATGVSLSHARRYVRVVYTPDLTATATDTATVAAALTFAGFDELPAPA
jgi:hypothetical protein